MASYLITGANRGLGLLMTSILASKPATEVSKVIAAVRSSNDNVDNLVKGSNGRVIKVIVEVTNEESVSKLVQEATKVLDNGLDVLINNAGICQAASSNAEKGVEVMDNLNEHWDINVNAVHLVSKALLPLIRKGKKKTIVNITSTMGSITLAHHYMFQPTPAYKISKAALNMMTVQYAEYLGKDGFIVFCINPGWARTRMGSENADLDPKEAAECLIQKILKVTKEDSGKFFETDVPSWDNSNSPNRYDGRVLPW